MERRDGWTIFKWSGRIVGCIMELIGLGGVPDDVMTWGRWLTPLQGYISHNAARWAFVVSGAALLLLTEFLNRRRRSADHSATAAHVAPPESMRNLKTLSRFWFKALASVMTFLEANGDDSHRWTAIRGSVSVIRGKLQAVAEPINKLQPGTSLADFESSGRCFIETVSVCNGELMALLEESARLLGGKAVFSSPQYKVICDNYNAAANGATNALEQPGIENVAAALARLERPGLRL